MRIRIVIFFLMLFNVCLSQKKIETTSIDNIKKNIDILYEYELLKKAIKYIDLNDTINAITCYNLALNKNTNLYEAAINLGHIYYKQKKFKSAENNFYKSLNISKNNKNTSLVAKSLYYLGNSQLSNAILSIKNKKPNILKIQESIENYKESLRINPENIDVKQNLAFAIELLNKHINKDKENQQDKQEKKEEKEEESEFEEELDELIKNVEQLKEKQKKLKEETENEKSSSENLTNEQEKLKKELDNIKHTIKDLENKNSNLNNQKDFPDLKAEQRNAEKLMTESKQALENKQKNNASKKQKETIENLEKISKLCFFAFRLKLSPLTTT